MKVIVFFFLLIFSGIALRSQIATPKTIRFSNDSILKSDDTVAVIPPFIFSGTTKSYLCLDSTNSMYFEDTSSVTPIANSEEVEKYYRKCCYFWYRRELNWPYNGVNHPQFNDSDFTIPIATKATNRRKLFIPVITIEDYKTIRLYLKQIEKILNDSIVSTIKINDSLFQILSKYSSSICVLADIKEYWYVGERKPLKAPNDICLYRLVAINMKTQKVYIYNSTVDSSQHGPEYALQFPESMVKKSPMQYTRLKPFRYMAASLVRPTKSSKKH